MVEDNWVIVVESSVEQWKRLVNFQHVAKVLIA